MCIAIYKPADKIIDKATLERCFNANPDGAGFMYTNGTEMKIHKGFFTFKSFWKAFEPHQERQCLIHFRIKTHGEISVKNCHPFFITKDIGFIHNGIISKHGGSRDVSDTRDFNEKVLRPLVKQFGTTIITAAPFAKLVEDYIGFSKLAFLDIHGNVTIMNEAQGNWHEDVWYSNQSWKPPVPLPYTYTPKYKSPGYSVYNKPPANASAYEEDVYATLTQNFGGILKGEEVIINSYGQYHTVDVETFEGYVVKNVPLSLLEFESAKPTDKQLASMSAADYYGYDLWEDY